MTENPDFALPAPQLISPSVQSITAKQSIMLETTKRKLEVLGFTKFNVKLTKIMFSVTNQGLSTEEMWRAFPVIFDISEETLKVSIIFSMNGKTHYFSENLLKFLLDFLTRINYKIPVGSFKYNYIKKSVIFECKAFYNVLPVECFELLVTEYLRTAMAIYKSFGHGLVLIASGRTDIREIVGICIGRTDGMIKVSVESEESSSSSEENSSNTEDLDKNKMNPVLMEIFSTDIYVANTIRLWNYPEHDDSIKTVIELFKEKGMEIIHKIIVKLQELFQHHIEFYQFGIEKVNVKMAFGEIECFWLKNPQKLIFVDRPTEEDCWDYIYQKVLEINKDTIAFLRGSHTFIMEKYQDYIVDSSKFQFSNINSSIHIIGQGGFGIVYKNVLANNQVAIKIPKKLNSSSKELLKLIDEFQIIKDLNHENIIKTYGFVKIKDSYGIILEQCQNGSLNNISRTHPYLTIKQKLEIMVKVAKAIEYMHLKNICHFDIKPHNILLDSNFEPKITDLGLSRNINNKVNTKLGFTLIYCSPEQIKGRRYDKKSDVWSFGMTLYNFLTYISPFDYITNNGKKKLDKNEFYHEIYNEERKPRIPVKFQLEHQKIVKILNDMWRIDSEKRSSSKQVRQALSKYLLSMREI